MKYIPVLILIVLAALTRCAKQTTPTGGPRDTLPPILLQSIPPDQTTGFKGQRIVLTFDELVALNNPREQLLITPSIGKDFEMTVRKKSAYLELNAELQDSTTYTINFRESVQDITEKNPAPNLQIALSTGSYIDSLSIAGYVYQLLSGTPAENAAVALYVDHDTFDIFTHKPEYLTLCDKNGTFLFQNLRPGEYYIYAFDDKNRNITVDSRSESYGFIQQPLNLRPGHDPFIQIPLVTLDARPLRLISARPYNTYFNIRASKNLNTYNLEAIEQEDTLRFHHTYGPDQANIQVYLPQIESDSIALNFTAADSIGNQLDTTLYAKLAPRVATPEPFRVTSEKLQLFPETFTITSTIKANKPVLQFTYDSIVYELDSATTIPLSAEDITLSDQTKITLHKILPAEHFTTQTTARATDDFRSGGTPQSKSQINQLRLGKGAFISIENDSSAATQVKATILRGDNTGTIIAKVQTTEDYYIVRLLNRDYSVNQIAHNQSDVTFRNLPPGDYMISLVIDRNNNRQWDPGSFYRREEPEPVVFYRNDEGTPTISIKANWELGPLLITYPEPVDNPAVAPRR